ncbi:hypothetical protein V5O48_014918 [Marasmius crinis-equi]|uniref:Uncharacterized protein n=1 Tax=Marasmius crinis-equi TaxID=585013 RepID=A0ABR3EWA2_9AGAR
MSFCFRAWQIDYSVVGKNMISDLGFGFAEVCLGEGEGWKGLKPVRASTVRLKVKVNVHLRQKQRVEARPYLRDGNATTRTLPPQALIAALVLVLANAADIRALYERVSRTHDSQDGGYVPGIARSLDLSLTPFSMGDNRKQVWRTALNAELLIDISNVPIHGISIDEEHGVLHAVLRRRLEAPHELYSNPTGKGGGHGGEDDDDDG